MFGVGTSLAQIMQTPSDSLISLNSAITAVRNRYTRSGLRNGNTVSYNLDIYGHAYLKLYGEVHLKASKSIFQELAVYTTLPSVLKVCCIGGGPGVEAAGLLESVSDKISEFHCWNVDLYSGWKSFYDRLISPDCFPTVKVVEPHFLEADLGRRGNGELKEVVEQVDVVLIFKFLSQYNGDVGSLLSEIFSWMKPGSIVVYMDGKSDYLSYFQLQSNLQLSAFKNLFSKCNIPFFNPSIGPTIYVRYEAWKKS